MKTDFSSSFDPRNKVVSFRISGNEYDLASDFCKTSGYNGMSMLARSAFLAYLPQPTHGSDETDNTAPLRAELQALHAELARLIAALSRIRQHINLENESNSLPPSSGNIG